MRQLPLLGPAGEQFERIEYRITNKEFRMMIFSFDIHHSLFDILRFKRIDRLASLQAPPFNPLSLEGILDFAVLYPDDMGQKPPKIPGLLLSPGM